MSKPKVTIAQLEAHVAANACAIHALEAEVAKLSTRLAHLEAARPWPQRELPLPSNRRAAMQAAKEEAMRTGKSVLVA